MVAISLPALFRGIPFGVDGTSGSNGRRIALHQYAYRDTVWAEDLGQAPRTGSIDGFLLGDLVPVLRLALTQAAETKGPASLVHPTLGLLNVTLTAPLKWREDKNALGRLNFTLEWVEASERLFPNSTQDLTSGINLAVVLTVAQVGLSLVNSVANGGGVGSFLAVEAGVFPFASQIISQIGSATTVGNSTIGLNSVASSLTNGRYTFGPTNDGGLITYATVPPNAATTISGAITNAILTTSANIHAATLAAEALSTNPTTDLTDYAASILTAVQAAAATAQDPTDALAMLASLAQPSDQTPSSGPAVAPAAACRRYALVVMCGIIPTIQFSSLNDAQACLTLVTGLLDAEILIAMNNFEDAVSSNMQDLRAQVVQSLTGQGANLAPLVTRTFPTSLPACVISQRLYQTSDRADDIVARNDIIHPGFCPTSLTVLAS